jgi:hypothetical protein
MSGLMNPEITSCESAWRRMTKLSEQGPVRNFVQTLDMSDFVVETPLFPKGVLEAYSAWNMGQGISSEQTALKTEQRGGSQGDYRDGMAEKINNVVDCLTSFPKSKRAVIVISNDPAPPHSSDADAKCLREIHFHLDDGKLNGTMLLRAQAASIFPKNIHFVGSIMTEVADRLPQQASLGSMFYLATVLVSDRG